MLSPTLQWISVSHNAASMSLARSWSSRLVKSRTRLLLRTVYSTCDSVLDLSEYTPERIRNFSIIAHIDHGKSTLADRLLELTGCINQNNKNKQVLDKLQVERERGITVKAQTASMIYNHGGVDYLLNLIDTPGHVDFTYEVSRSLAACQGALLLVDATKGVQAQTTANFYLAFGQNLKILPILNKVDMDSADIPRVSKEIESQFELSAESCLPISAKTGFNCEAVLRTIVESIPPPHPGDPKCKLRALLFDSFYQKYSGAVTLLYIVDGSLSPGDRVKSSSTGLTYTVSEIGIYQPDPKKTKTLRAGQVGYAILGMKSCSEAHIGDTISSASTDKNSGAIVPLPGFVRAKPVVFCGVYPANANELSKLSDSISRLTLNDASVSVQNESSNSLGRGFRLGFLGALHMDVFKQRLEQEHGTKIVCTSPTVPLQIRFKNGEVKTIDNPLAFPDTKELVGVESIEEPIIVGKIESPPIYVSAVTQLCQEYRGRIIEVNHPSSSRTSLSFKLPMMETVADFFPRLKAVSSGYATFDYEFSGYENADISKLTILLNNEPYEPLSRLCHDSKLRPLAQDLVSRLKDNLDRQQVDIIIQAAVGKKIFAREKLSGFRKDVTAKGGGGDVTRKAKLLAQQKAGKKEMMAKYKVSVSQETLIKMSRTNS